MSFREEFLEKISGFSYERLRTEQRLLEQERDSLREEVNLLNQRIKTHEEGSDKLSLEKKPFADELEELNQKYADRERKLYSEFHNISSNKKATGELHGIFYFAPFLCMFFIPAFADLPPKDSFFANNLVIFALWVLLLVLVGLLSTLVENRAKAKNKERENKINIIISSDKELKSLTESKAPLEKKVSEISNEVQRYFETNIEPLKEEVITLQNRIDEISSLLKDVLADLLKTTRKKERNAKYKAVLGEARDQSQSIKNFLLSETDENWTCPYCNEKKDKETAEADHIHPVSKGGQSTLQNMVLICYDCNRGKTDSTLRNFCKVKGYSFDEVCERLESDGKEI